ncbi:MAG: hypothetical protein V2B18_19010 [Pseudomonadota bacterium]
MTLEHATSAFLVVLFVVAEIYRLRRARRGVILALNEGGPSFVALPVTPAKVRMNDGKVVTASLGCCTACLGRLKVGDEVLVADTKEGFTVELPWVGTRRRRSSAGGCG